MADDDAATRAPAVVVPAACAVWLALWWLTPGLHARGLGRLVTDDDGTSVLVESAVALVVLAVLLAAHRDLARSLVAPSRACWVYVLPAALAVALPFHYGLGLPVGVYMAWMAASVLWQDVLTFGLLQHHVGRRLSTPWAVGVVAVTFWAGHAWVLPDRFGLDRPVASLAMLALGAVLAVVRARLGTLHVLLALHLAFYLAFA
ncbi:hypothetical protein [Cellulomonas phragmiteti]|uniref:CPBP family intramembrane metalloprotease n=1 Tax=Cellulomonas phragmiteti TaxID=478780 RepID=A0ABQ4DG41_9CELL|nr:hypothetical protein [Cellulomonas phragmiteti]GIG38318.1 hypothetical protein Cph01nite_00800 [Cellulomonas phragmiteti]